MYVQVSKFRAIDKNLIKSVRCEGNTYVYGICRSCDWGGEEWFYVGGGQILAKGVVRNKPLDLLAKC